MKFLPLNFLINTKYMLVGMLTIVAVIGAIILATSFLNRIFKD